MQPVEIPKPDLPQEPPSREQSEHDSQPATPQRESDEATLQRLAALPRLEYERERKAAAKSLGYRTTILDKLVNALRTKSDAGQTTGALQGREADFEDVELWPESVNGADVLSEVAETFFRYIALPDGAADALALWCAHTHVYDVFDCSPRLNVSSPDKQCGKTTCRDLVAKLVPRPLQTENLTVAVLFRLIEAYVPTILADECDGWLRDKEELRSLLNAGHKRGGVVPRCVGEKHEVRNFRVFAPAMLCGIGSLPETLHDRSIEIRLRRAKPSELRERFDSRRTQREQELCRKLARVCADSRAALEACDPVLPPGVFNRLADNWRPLFAIAEVVGGDWPQRAVASFAKLTSKQDPDTQGIGVMLLADIQVVLNKAKGERIFSRVLVEKLCSMTDRPWSEAHRGKAITEVWLARRLRPFDVHSKDVRIGKNHAKGYEAADFAEAFERYLYRPEEFKRDNVTSPINKGTDESFKRDESEPCHGNEAQGSPENIDLSRCHASNSATASVPFMITRKMDNDLRTLGYSRDEINRLTPAQAGKILERRQRSEKPARSVSIIYGDGWVAA